MLMTCLLGFRYMRYTDKYREKSGHPLFMLPPKSRSLLFVTEKGIVTLSQVSPSSLFNLNRRLFSPSVSSENSF